MNSYKKQNSSHTINKTITQLLLVVLFVIVVTACNNDDDNPALTPFLSSISPESGPKNTEVTINGSHFGTNTASVKVFFNGIEANVQLVTDTEIITEVPRLALTGVVKVLVDGKELIGPEFTYLFSEAHVSTLAGKIGELGYTDGQGTEALFGLKTGITLDGGGNVIIIEPWNNNVRKITPDGVVSTSLKSDKGYIDGTLSEAKINNPFGVASDASGNTYLADTNNNRIRKISSDGMVSTLAGGSQGYVDGTGTEAKFFLPKYITVDNTGNVYVTDGDLATTSRIRKITPDGLVTTLAGSEKGFADGQGVDARFDNIRGLAIDLSGNIIVADAKNNKIRKISPAGQVSTIAGSSEGFADGSVNESKFHFPNSVTVDKLDNIYVTDTGNKIRKISHDGIVSTIAGSNIYGTIDGEGLDAQFTGLSALVVDDDFNLFVIQTYVIRKITQE